MFNTEKFKKIRQEQNLQKGTYQRKIREIDNEISELKEIYTQENSKCEINELIIYRKDGKKYYITSRFLEESSMKILYNLTNTTPKERAITHMYNISHTRIPEEDLIRIGVLK